MVTYGGNRPTVKDDEVLTAQDFNDATRFWVTDELPDAGKDGDVVFVVGDEPSGGGINVESQRKHQLLQGNDSKGWVPGMAMSVVDQLPADDAEGYAIGDVVFVTGPGDGGSPAVGGGKVLQVVYADFDNSFNTQSTTGTTPVPVRNMTVTMSNIQAGSHVLLGAGLLLQAASATNEFNRVHAQIVNSDGNPMPGATDARVGGTSYQKISGKTPTYDQYTTMIARDASPGTSQSWTVEMWSDANDITCSALAGSNQPLLYAIEVGA